MEPTLKNLRKLRLITQTQAAKLLNLSKSHLCEIEGLKKPVSLELLRKIITIYELSETEIIAYILEKNLDVSPPQLKNLIDARKNKC